MALPSATLQIARDGAELQGLGRNDAYHHNVGDGNDVIQDWSYQGNADLLVLGAGIAPADVTGIHTVANDLLLTFTSGGSVLLQNEFGGDGFLPELGGSLKGDWPSPSPRSLFSQHKPMWR